MGNRATDTELLQRIGEISKLLINGSGKDEIVRFSAEKYGVKERMTEKYISKAKLLIENSVEKQVNYDYAKAVRRYENLYQLSIEKKDYRTALSVNKELTTLQGLFKQEIEHSGEIKFVCSIPD